MIVQSAFTLPVPMDAAFDLLVDAQAVAHALRQSHPVADGALEGELIVPVGDTAVTYRGRITPGERDREAGALSFHVVGSEVRGRGRVTAGGAIRLRQAEEATAVAVQLDVDVSGRMAQQGVDAVEAALRAVLDDLAAGLRQEAAERHPRPAVGGPDGDGAAAAELVAYPWMTAGGPSAGHREAEAAAQAAAAAAQSAGAAAQAAGAAAQAAAAQAAAAARRPRPTWSFPAPPTGPRPRRQVPGRVTVVTDGALSSAGIPVGDGALARAQALQRRRPWLLPALLLGLLVAVLLLRRRRR